MSVASDGAQGSGTGPGISADGRYVAFQSSARDLVTVSTPTSATTSS